MRLEEFSVRKRGKDRASVKLRGYAIKNTCSFSENDGLFLLLFAKNKCTPAVEAEEEEELKNEEVMAGHPSDPGGYRGV